MLKEVMMMRRLLFVFNPHSGTGKIRKQLSEVLDIFTKSGYETVVYPTQAPGDGMKKILAGVLPTTGL